MRMQELYPGKINATCRVGTQTIPEQEKTGESRRFPCLHSFILFRRPFFRDEIDAAFMEGMTAQNPLGRQVTAFQRTVFLDSFQPVMRTCRIKATRRREQWRDEALIKTDETEHDVLQTISFFLKSYVRTFIVVKRVV